MFKKNSTKSSVFKIVVGNLLIILIAYSYALWFYSWHSNNDDIISELYGLRSNISKLHSIQNNILDREMLDNRFFNLGESELTESYETEIELAQNKIVSLQWANSNDLELGNLYSNLQEDLLKLKSENELLLNYLKEAGNEQTGIYNHLLMAESNFLKKTEASSNYADIRNYFNQITVYSKVFYLYNDLSIYTITNSRIDALLAELNRKKGVSNSYNYLRLIDGLQEYKQVFNLFARKLMQIGIRKDAGIRKNISSTYGKVDHRIDEIISLIESIQKSGNISTGLIILSLILSGVLISVLFYYRFIKRLKSFVVESENYFSAIIKGKSIKVPARTPNDDYFELQKQMDYFSQKLAITSTMMNELAKTGAVRVSDDIVNESIFPQINDIDKYIKSLSKQLKSETNQTLINEWIRKGLASFSDVLRRNFDMPQQHAKEILSNLVDYLNIPMGAIYLPSDKIDGSYDLVGSVAYGKTKQYTRSVISGEGIIGTVAKEKKTLNITNIPEGYFKVSSGFGEAKPKNIVAIPIKLEDTVYGIIELASLNEFKKFELEFIDELSKNLGASFAITDVFLKTKENLEQTEKKYSLIKTETETYKSEMKDLKERNEYFENKNIEFEIINNSINTIAMVADLDLDGNILELNNAFIEVLKKTKENLVHTNYWDHTTQSGLGQDIDLEKFWNNIRSGITDTLEQNFVVSDKRIFLSETYIPIKDKFGKVERIKVIAFNKTELKSMQTEFGRLIQSLDAKEKVLYRNKAELDNKNKKITEQADQIKENKVNLEKIIKKLKEEHIALMTKYIDEQQQKESALYDQITQLRNELENLKK